MLKGFQNTLDSIVGTLKSNGEDAHYFEKEGRFFIRIDEMMSDAGFSCDNIVLDVFFDEDERVLFIGMLRFPKHLRRKGLGDQIMSKIIQYANDFQFYIYLDAWNESQRFWRKYGFVHLYYDTNLFDIMGFAPEGAKDDAFHEFVVLKKYHDDTQDVISRFLHEHEPRDPSFFNKK